MAEKQLNIRLSDEAKAKFDEAVKSSGLTQAEFLSQMLVLAESQDVKALVPEVATDIDSVEAHLNSIRDAYIASVKRYTNAYDIAADKVRSQLEALGTLTSENQRLTAENKEVSIRLAERDAELSRIKEEFAKIKAAANDAEKLKEELLETKEQLLELREKHQGDLEAMRQAHQSELIEALVKAMKEK